MDLRFYKRLNVWINARTSNPGDAIRIRLGSTENDYYEYQFLNDYGPVWREVVLNLRNESGGINRSLTEGNPDLKRVSYMEVIVDSAGAGRLWVNDMYASDPDTLTDSAHWYEVELRGNGRFSARSPGCPLSPICISSISRRGMDHSSAPWVKPRRISPKKYRQLFTPVNILPEWRLRLDLSQEKSVTDSFNTEVAENKRGRAEKRSFYVESDYAPTASAVPKIKIVYKNDAYENERGEDITVGTDTYRVQNLVKSRAHNPTILVKEEIAEVFGGKLSTSLQMDMTFKKETVSRSADGLDAPTLETYLPLHESDKASEGDNGAQHRLPVEQVPSPSDLQGRVAGNRRVVGKKTGLSDTEVRGDVNGDYHLPFVYAGDYKSSKRNNKTTLYAGMRKLWIFSPSVRSEFQYFENRFRDYQGDRACHSGRSSARRTPGDTYRTLHHPG